MAGRQCSSRQQATSVARPSRWTPPPPPETLPCAVVPEPSPESICAANMFADIRMLLELQSAESCTTIAPSDKGRIAAGTLDVNQTRRYILRPDPSSTCQCCMCRACGAASLVSQSEKGRLGPSRMQRPTYVHCTPRLDSCVRVFGTAFTAAAGGTQTLCTIRRFVGRGPAMPCSSCMLCRVDIVFYVVDLRQRHAVPFQTPADVQGGGIQRGAVLGVRGRRYDA